MTPAFVLADGPTGEAAKSGPWGLAIILLLCAGCYFLFKSMSKHLRKVREQFPRDSGQQSTQTAARPTDQADDALPADVAGDVAGEASGTDHEAKPVPPAE